jgi:hypothetical protein
MRGIKLPRPVKTKWMKLPRPVKAKWIKALRSGTYKQYKGGALYDAESDSYCCLGVLAKVIGVKPRHNDLYGDNPREKVFLGVDSDDHTMASRLADMNDERCSFKQIANYIEKNL